ncbi:hypothetical protein FHS42_005607 [Streptomyces zagrosensis]|uniref:Uncharacterized protein n=1 Tax=Streptomyces zagrosensis TaxID=1042984 RepID=A0A7W9QF19_9ACTN|nr:hypothetical protein [Streptomyces zagrosensis]
MKPLLDADAAQLTRTATQSAPIADSGAHSPTEVLSRTDQSNFSGKQSDFGVGAHP